MYITRCRIRCFLNQDPGINFSPFESFFICTEATLVIQMDQKIIIIPENNRFYDVFTKYVYNKVCNNIIFIHGRLNQNFTEIYDLVVIASSTKLFY